MGGVFSFYQKELEKSEIYSKIPTARIASGVDNYNLTHYSFYGFLNVQDIFPIQYLDFEGEKIPFPNNMKEVAKKEFGNLGWPNDVGISHDIENLNNWLKASGQAKIPYKEI